jgi:hypothetical protein
MSHRTSTLPSKLWPDQAEIEGAKPDRLKLALPTREAIVKYTGGVLPPTDE